MLSVVQRPRLVRIRLRRVRVASLPGRLLVAHAQTLTTAAAHLLKDKVRLLLLGERTVGFDVHLLQHLRGARHVPVLFLDLISFGSVFWFSVLQTKKSVER